MRLFHQTEQDLIDILEMYHINVRVPGEEYRERDFTGKDVCRKRGIELHFNKREHRSSTTDLRERVNNAPSKKRLNKLKKEHKALDEQVKTLYNTTNSERTLKELKVKKSQTKR